MFKCTVEKSNSILNLKQFHTFRGIPNEDSNEECSCENDSVLTKSVFSLSTELDEISVFVEKSLTLLLKHLISEGLSSVFC